MSTVHLIATTDAIFSNPAKRVSLQPSHLFKVSHWYIKWADPAGSHVNNCANHCHSERNYAEAWLSNETPAYEHTYMSPAIVVEY